MVLRAGTETVVWGFVQMQGVWLRFQLITLWKEKKIFIWDFIDVRAACVLSVGVCILTM